WCWGENGWGQLGNGTFTTAAAPVQVAPGTTWSMVAAGANWTCAIRSDDTLWCWGADSYGTLGLGFPGATRSLPTQVGTQHDWTCVDASGGAEELTCGIRSGELWCWGQNVSGFVTHGLAALTTPVTVVDGPANGPAYCSFPQDLDQDGYADCYGDSDDS